MFKVLTGEKKRRVFSPATIIASVAAHLLLLGGLVYASTGDPEFVDSEICLDCELPPLPEEHPAPPPPPIEQPRLPAPADEPVKRPVAGEVLEVPRVDVVPDDGVKPEEEGVKPINPEDYRRDGRPGDIIGPRTTEDHRPPTGDTVVSEPTGPIRAESAEVRPELRRNGLSRILERHYPPVLRDARVSGRVVIELVVDEEGVPVEGSARVIEASHPAFGEAALRAVDRFRFSPARIGSKPIPVVVTIPIQWTVPN